MDAEIKSELDELLALGRVSTDDYKRRLDALDFADELLLASEIQKVSSVAREDQAGAKTGVVPPPLPGASIDPPQPAEQVQAGLWAKFRRTWDDLPFPRTRQFLLMAYILMWIYKVPANAIAFLAPGYVFGAFFGLLPYVIGLFRKSNLTGKSMWGCIVSGSLSFGILAMPVSIAYVVKMFRQKKTCHVMA